MAGWDHQANIAELHADLTTTKEQYINVIEDSDKNMKHLYIKFTEKENY